MEYLIDLVEGDLMGKVRKYRMLVCVKNEVLQQKGNRKFKSKIITMVNCFTSTFVPTSCEFMLS